MVIIIDYNIIIYINTLIDLIISMYRVVYIFKNMLTYLDELNDF